MCLGCNMDFLKASCAGHFKAKHKSENLDTKAWACVKDGNTLGWARKQSKRDDEFSEEAYLQSHLLLTRAMGGGKGPKEQEGCCPKGDFPSDVSEAGLGEVEEDEVGGESEGEVGGVPTFWKKGFLRVDAQGQVVMPFAFVPDLPKGGVEWGPAKATPPWKRSRPASTAASSSNGPHALVASAPAPPWKRSRPASAAPSSNGPNVHALEASAPAGVPTEPVPQPALQSVAEETLALVKQQLGLGWQKGLPAVRVKASASSVELPLAKASGEVRRSGPWPKELYVPNLPLAGFEQYLSSKKVDPEKQDQVKDHNRGMNRFFGLLEHEKPDSPGAIRDDENMHHHESHS